METALSLLLTAMQLLSFVSGASNLPVEVVDSAKKIAQDAIIVAELEIAKIESSIAIPVVMSEPVPTKENVVLLPQELSLGSINVMPEATTPSKRMDVVAITRGPVDPINNLPYGSVIVRTTVIDEGTGDGVQRALMAMHVGDEVVELREAMTHTGKNVNDWHTSFEFIPETPDSYRLGFSYGSFDENDVYVPESDIVWIEGHVE